jgi:hypothetical protein
VFFSTLTTPDGALLPPNTSAQGGSSTTSDNAAAFIKVVVQQRSMANALITLVGGPKIASTTATATAGFQQISCKPMQLMICNPNEVSGKPFNPQPGQELVMPYSGGQSQAPGNWGLMDAPATVSAAAQACGVTPGGNGSPVIEAYLASAAPIGCFSTSQLITRPGKPTPVAPALDALFDWYHVPGNKVPSNSSCFPPAPDVVKGMDGAACSPSPATPPAAYGFPDDSAFTGILGNGNWDLNTYWANNHGGAPPAALTTFAQGLSPSGITPAGIPSRYATYLYEINNTLVPKAGTPAGHLENGAPACYFKPSDPNITASRRLIDIGLVNCNQQGVGGRSAITPYGMLQTFMTRPTDGTGINFEVVKTVTANSGDGVLHTIVQLYR